MERFEHWRLGAVALLCAAALTACGSDDEPSSTTAGTTPAADTTATTSPNEPATTPADPATDPAATDTDTADTDAADLPDNGFAGQSASNILAAATTAAQQALSVHVVGAVDDTSFDITFVRDEGSFGEVTVDGTSFEIVAAGDRFFMRGDDAFYEQIGGASLVELIGDKWLAGPVDDPQFSGVAALANVDRLLEESLDPSGTITKGAASEVGGRPTIELVSDDGTLDVATTGTPLPLRIIAQEGRGEMRFEGWDDEFEIPIPGESIDVAELQRGAATK